MRKSGVRFPKAARRAFVLARGLFRRNLDGQHCLIPPVQTPISPHLVRIRSGEGLVESACDGVQVIGERPA